MEEKCGKEDYLRDLKGRVEKLEENDREGYGSIKELALSIKMFTASNKEQSQAMIAMGKTLEKVDLNLDMLSSNLKETKSQVEHLEEKVQTIEGFVSKTQGSIERKDKYNQINEGKLNRKVTFSSSLIGFIIGAILTFGGEIIIKIIFKTN